MSAGRERSGLVAFEESVSTQPSLALAVATACAPTLDAETRLAASIVERYHAAAPHQAVSCKRDDRLVGRTLIRRLGGIVGQPTRLASTRDRSMLRLVGAAIARSGRANALCLAVLQRTVGAASAAG